ncbi:hypothetical protein NDU88_001895 [Pleurodeles waltl]|uniref:Uncharacterized protein n=1 Tax=Pleurodeles waltl TaxID=8319 RepID=A0AAV7VB26_PLEWA|nr:hypothetical protein NDU88_001895 [Pleurodeles waltl]
MRAKGRKLRAGHTNDWGSHRETYADYYDNFYASGTDISAADCKDFLRDIQLQELQKDERDALEAVMIEEEVTLVLEDLQTGNAAGQNGIPVELYKGMATVIASPLLEILNFLKKPETKAAYQQTKEQ